MKNVLNKAIKNKIINNLINRSGSEEGKGAGIRKVKKVKESSLNSDVVVWRTRDKELTAVIK